MLTYHVPLYQHKYSFERFHSKIIHVVLPPEISQNAPGAKLDLKDWRPNFKVQEAQRDELWRQLKEKLEPQVDDLIMKADLDEIPKVDVLEQLACAEDDLPQTPICLGTGTDGFFVSRMIGVS